MDINRNQYFLAGIVILLLGIQFRLIDSVVITPKCNRLLSSRATHMAMAGGGTAGSNENAESEPKSKTIHPPEWLGWALLSLGTVLVLHSMAMKRPD